MSVHHRPGGTTSIAQHLVEDHAVEPGWAECASDGAICGRHDGLHGVTWAESLTEGQIAELREAADRG